MVIITCLGLRKCPEPDDRAVETEHIVLARPMLPLFESTKRLVQDEYLDLAHM